MTDSNNNRPLVSIVRIDSYEPDKVSMAIKKVLGPLGGIEKFVPDKEEVILKPNFLKASKPEEAVSPHPEIMRAVARSVLSAGAQNVVVVDSPAVSTASRCAKKLGLNDDIFKIEDLVDAVEMTTPNGMFKKIKLSKRLLDAKSIINIAKAKTHGQMVLTLAVKNLFGSVVGLEKAQWHLRAGVDETEFARLIIEIFEMIKPGLSILDAVYGMEGNGPGSGDARKLGFIMASESAHALDAIFCQALGINPRAVFTVDLALKMGLIPPLKEIEIVGPDPESLKPSPPWKMSRPLSLQYFGPVPRAFVKMFDRFLEVRPAIDPKKCTMCGECVKVCAAKAMKLDKKKKKRAILDKDKCISCFCCQEVCPEGAITVSAGWLAKLLGLGTS